MISLCGRNVNGGPFNSNKFYDEVSFWFLFGPLLETVGRFLLFWSLTVADFLEIFEIFEMAVLIWHWSEKFNKTSKLELPMPRRLWRPENIHQNFCSPHFHTQFSPIKISRLIFNIRRRKHPKKIHKKPN